MSNETPLQITAAVVQLCSRQDIGANLACVTQLVQEAAARGAELVVLPENYPYIGSLRQKAKQSESLSKPYGPVLSHAVSLARQQNIHLLLGGVPIRCDIEGKLSSQKFFNTSILLAPDGQVLASYRKIHLFDIAIPHGAVFMESEHVVPGTEVVTTEALGTTIGLSVCYDLRFPELYRALVSRGARLVTVPAAFTLHTGKDHWFPLLRARAIENQVFVLAAGQHGRHTNERSTFGKSCIIDPWGAVIAQCPDTNSVAVARLDFGYLDRIRRELPALDHRRMKTMDNDGSV